MRLIESEIQQLKFKILDMAELVQFQLDNITDALLDLDKDLARKIRKKERKIDKYDTKIDKRCERIIALYQPVANDLRFVFSVLKINAYLEQIGDHIYSIASTVPELKEHKEEKLMKDVGLDDMMEKTKEIVREALMSYFNEDAAHSKSLFAMEQELLKMHDEAQKRIVKRIQQKPEHAETLVQLVLIFRNLKRIARLGFNIAEEAIFHLEGEVYRHNTHKLSPGTEENQGTIGGGLRPTPGL